MGIEGVPEREDNVDKAEAMAYQSDFAHTQASRERASGDNLGAEYFDRVSGRAEKNASEIFELKKSYEGLSTAELERESRAMRDRLKTLTAEAETIRLAAIKPYVDEAGRLEQEKLKIQFEIAEEKIKARGLSIAAIEEVITERQK